MNQMDLIFLQLLVMHTCFTNSALFNVMPTLCTCPGTDLTYECTIMDEHASGATVWTGTAFSCSDTEDELTFLHIGSRFTNTSKGCNDGAIRGRGIRIEGSRYTSQVNITVDSYMDGRSIECVYDQDMGKTLVGNSSIMITSVPFPPPTESDIMVNITNVTNGSLQLAFKWTPVAPDCSAIIGYIITSDCGYCPNTTYDTQVVCTDVIIGSQCSFTFQTRVCSSLIGNVSTVILTLKVPDAPVVSFIPSYSHKTGILTRVIMQFNEPEKFDIFDNVVSGSTIHYFISFTATDSGVTCGSTNISASSCMEGVCKHTYHFSSRACLNSENINMNVLATNVLGSGNPYNTTIGFINLFFKVNFNANFTKATCKLIYKIRLNCTLVYKSHRGNNNRSLTSSTLMGTSQTDTVTFNLDTLPNVKYYFTATASSGRDTAVVEGTFTRLRQTDVMSPFTVSGYVFWGVVGAMGIVMITVVITATFTVAISLRRISKLSPTNQLTERLEQDNRESLSPINTERNIAYETILGGTSVIQDSHP